MSSVCVICLDSGSRRASEASETEHWREALSGWIAFDLRVSPSLAQDATKADMARGRVDRLSMPRGGPVAAAIDWRAEMRAALQHLAGNANLRLAGIVAVGLRPAARILRHAAGLGRVG